MRKDTRLTSFTLPAIWCPITAVSLAVRCIISFVSLAVCCMTSVASLPSIHIRFYKSLRTRRRLTGVPSMSTFTLSSMLCETFNTSAVTMRTSSWVSLSSLFSAPSISFLPINFLRYFSDEHEPWVTNHCRSSTDLVVSV